MGVFTAMGPAHIHKPTEAVLVLEDIRRWKPRPARQPKLWALGGHSHGSVWVQQRHYHAHDDTSVVDVGADPGVSGSGAGESLSASASLAAFWALRPGAISWEPSQAANALASRPLWSPMSVVVDPLERPPKAA